LHKALWPQDLFTEAVGSHFFSWSGLPLAWNLPEVLADAQWIALNKPGSPEHVFQVESGTISVQSNLLSPGAWTLSAHNGSAPRAFLIGDRHPTPALTDLHLDGPRLYLEATGLSPAVEVFALWGEDRSWVPVNLNNWVEEELTLDISILPANEQVDLVLKDEGHTLALLDLFGEAHLDANPPKDTGFFPELDLESLDEEEADVALSAGSCTCGGSQHGKSWWVLFGLPALLLRGRSPRQPHREGYRGIHHLRIPF
jgi:hypothetical protein